MDKYRVKVTFTEPLLGTVALDEDVYDDYIRDKHPDLVSNDDAGVDELETIEEALEKGTTGFHRLDGKPILYDYVVKGFFKDACSMMRRVPKSLSGKLSAHKKVIDGLVFVEPRRIPIVVNGEIDILTRPLRAQTAQGERVALSRSEMVPAGSTIEFTLKVLGGVDEALLREWFDYGALRGFGQWRNGGFGTYTHQMERLG